MSGRGMGALVAGVGALVAVGAFFVLPKDTTTPTEATPPAPSPGESKPDKPEDPMARFARLPRLDVHTHLHPALLDLSMQLFDEWGVDMAVNLSGGPPGEYLEATLQMGRRARGRILTFTNVDWTGLDGPAFIQRAVSDLERAVRAGARGLKISKALGLAIRRADGSRVPIDDPLLAPLFDKAGELGVPVAIHVADPVAFWQPLDEQNERFEELRLHPEWSYADGKSPSHEALFREAARLYARHPKTNFIAVHVAGWPENLDEVAKLLDENPNVYVDTSARIPELGHHPRDKARAFFLRFADRILYGTDLGITPGQVMLGAPLAWRETRADLVRFFSSSYRYLETADKDFAHPTPIQGKWTIDGLELPQDVLRKVYWDNGARLLGIKKPPPARR
jgi:predicted TIM-barrel fold metal-dependent hydrolase